MKMKISKQGLQPCFFFFKLPKKQNQSLKIKVRRAILIGDFILKLGIVDDEQSKIKAFSQVGWWKNSIT